MTQIMRETAKVADTSTGGGHALQDQPNAPHRRHSLDASGLRFAVPYVSAAQACMLHPSQSLGTCRTTAPEKFGRSAYPNASWEHLSSCIQQFAIVMLGDARTKIDNARHAGGERRTQLLVSGETLLGPSQNVPAITQRNTLRCKLGCFCSYRGPPTPQKLESFFFGIFCSLEFSRDRQFHGTRKCPHRLSSDKLLPRRCTEPIEGQFTRVAASEAL